MNSIKIFTVLAFAIFLSACDEKLISKNENVQVKNDESKVDIYRSTKNYDNQKNPDIKLNEQQQKTVDQIIGSVSEFLTEKKEQSFPTINAYAKEHDWEIQEYNSPEFYQYKVKLKDGSGASILFEHYELSKNDIHAFSVWGLTPKQCHYLVNHYKYGAKFKVEVEKYYYGPDKTSGQTSSCNNLGTSDGKDIAFRLEHNNTPYGNDYDNFNEEIVQLLNKEYEQTINKHNTNIYFSKEPISAKLFRNDIDYAINTVNNYITIGYVTKDRCKEIIYHLPDGIQYKINGDNKCSQEVNTLELFK